jgi:amidase
MTDASDLSALEARRLIGTRKLSPVELLDSCLKRIDATNPSINAFVAMDEERARDDARLAEEWVMAGETLGALHGLPVGVKDLQATEGLRTTWGSLIYKDHVPTEDEASVANVRGAGAIIVGKTNTPEFGAGANTTNRVYGATGNPFNPKLTSAGSSGGSAAALALGQVPLATGSDYGGSLRTPAGFCGVVGFRPSPGVIPSVDKAAALLPWGVTGPMARSVGDAHLLLKSQLSIDVRDPFSSSDNLDIPDQLTGADLSSVRVAVSPDLGCAPVDKAIAAVFAARMKTFGHVFNEVEERAPDFSGVHDIFEVHRGLAFVAQHGERLATQRELLDRNVIDNTERGLKYSLEDVAKGNVEQTKLYKRVLSFFDDVDVLICPAASVSPFPHKQLFVEKINGETMPTYMRWLAIAYAPTMALCCVAAIPCGVDDKGLPFGIQIIGPKGADARVLEIAFALEQVLAGIPDTRRPVPDWRKLQKTKTAKA